VRLGWVPSRRRARELIENGCVSVNGNLVRKGTTVTAADDVRVSEPAAAAELRPNPDLKIETLYREESVLVVNKPGLVPCHPLNGREKNTVMNAVAAAYPEAAKAGEKPLEGGLVHRLDNGTSGALIIALNPDGFAALRSAIRRRDISRRYLALCAGSFSQAVEIATPIAHHRKNRRKMVVLPSKAASSEGRPAETIVQPLRRLPGFSLVEVRPLTGCRHQIRVHMASIGHPLVGDVLYGSPEAAELMPGRFWLHLSDVAFESRSVGHITIHAPLPTDLEAVLRRVSDDREILDRSQRSVTVTSLAPHD
jgi:23S rRNA pseudouridine1911/1915/1917 synthase